MASSRKRPSAREKRTQVQAASLAFLAYVRRVGASGTAREKRDVALFFGMNSIFGKMSSTAGKLYMPAIKDDFDEAAVRSRAESITSGQRK